MPEHLLSADDPQAFLAGLERAVAAALPPQLRQSALSVVRTRSLGDRLAGREGSIVSMRLTAPGRTLELSCSAGPRYVAVLNRTVGRIVVSRRILGLGDWLREFAHRIEVLAGDAPGRSPATADSLKVLGISVSSPQVSVEDATLVADLQTLGFKTRKHLPPPASAALVRIVDLLLGTLPKVTAGSEAEALAHRTATVYLPETLQAYLRLPVEWARGHVYADGSTPDSALLEQLALLEQAVERMHEAAVHGDADVLLVNGRFLSYKFEGPEPDPDPGGDADLQPNPAG